MKMFSRYGTQEHNQFSEGFVRTNGVSPHLPNTKRTYYVVNQRRNIILNYGSAEKFARRGFQLILQPTSNTVGATRRDSTSINQVVSKGGYFGGISPAEKAKQDREEELFKTRQENNKKLQDEANKVNQLIADLNSQLSAVGGAGSQVGSDIASQIEALKKKSEADFKNANLENTRQIEAITSGLETFMDKITNQVNEQLSKVQEAGAGAVKSASGFFGGISDFFQNNQAIMIIGALVVIMIMVKRK